MLRRCAVGKQAYDRHAHHDGIKRLRLAFPLALLFFVAPLIPLLRGTTLDYLVDRQAWAWPYAVNIYHAEHGEWSLSYINHARRPLLPGL